MNILECTIKMKKETQAHFERLAEETTQKELKRLFLMIAAAKGEYINRLVELGNRLSMTDFMELEKLDETVCVYSPRIDPAHLAEILKEDSDAYCHVEREEKESIEFFEILSSETENEQLKRVFTVLADKEREHREVLENIYSFVEDPRTYLEWGEFSNLKSL